MADLERINAEANAGPYKHDPPTFDDWRPGELAAGRDCDSYAVAKLRAAVAVGFKIQALRLATCYVPPYGEGSYHCILIASLPEGDVALDNRYNRVVPVLNLIDGLGCRPHLIQKEGGSLEWVEWTGANGDI